MSKKYELVALFTEEEAERIVEIFNTARDPLVGGEAVKQYLLPLAKTWPAGVSLDDVVYKIVSHIQHKGNGHL